MTDLEELESGEPKKKSKKPLLFGLVLAIVLGGAGFYAVWSGLILAPPHETSTQQAAGDPTQPLPSVSFVPVQPLVVNIGTGGKQRHLRFQAQLEVKAGTEAEVTKMLPRVVDVLNSYLRAVETSELEQRTALVRLRAQMLRRVQIVTGEGRVRDLLIMEFVLN